MEHMHCQFLDVFHRRTTKQEENNGKKKYRKKPKDTVRLCADDVMTRNNLERFQDTYAEKMQNTDWSEVSKALMQGIALLLNITENYLPQTKT